MMWSTIVRGERCVIPKIQNIMNNITVRAGQSASFNCQVDQLPTDMSCDVAYIEWYHEMDNGTEKFIQVRIFIFSICVSILQQSIIEICNKSTAFICHTLTSSCSADCLILGWSPHVQHQNGEANGSRLIHLHRRQWAGPSCGICLFGSHLCRSTVNQRSIVSLFWHWKTYCLNCHFNSTLVCWIYI